MADTTEQAPAEKKLDIRMETKHGKAKCKMAYKKPLSSYKDKDGNALPAFIEYDFDWSQYANTDTMVAHKDELTLKEQLKVRQVEAKTTARQAANTALLESLGIVKPTGETDSQIRLKDAYKGIYPKLVTQKNADGTLTFTKDEAHKEARRRAAEFLGDTWEDAEAAAEEDEEEEEAAS